MASSFGALMALLVLALSASNAEAFLLSSTQPAHCTALHVAETPLSSNGVRRRVVLLLPTQVLISILPTTSAAAAALAKLTPEQAQERFLQGYQSLTYLLEHYDEICQGGGDNVRRYLGTVGTTSGLVGMDKTLKALESRAPDDLLEFTETSQELIRCIQQADGSSYMAIFVTTSSSSTPPQKYFDDAKIEIKRGIQAMRDIAAMIDVKL